MADPVALAGIGATAVVALSTPLLVARLERRRLQWQITQSRWDQLADILDEAGALLSDATRAKADAENAIYRSEQPQQMVDQHEREAEPPMPGAAVDRFEALAHEAWRLSARMALRLGNAHTLWRLWNNVICSRLDRTGQRLRREVQGQVRDKAAPLRELAELLACQHEFNRLTSAVIGPMSHGDRGPASKLVEAYDAEASKQHGQRQRARV